MEAQAAAQAGSLGDPNAAAARRHRQLAFWQRLFPEVAAGGFPRNDQMVVFFTRVRALLRSDSIVLDYGAGRGRWADNLTGYKRAVVALQGEQRNVVGFDVDPVVRDNPLVDEAAVGALGAPLPFADDTFDLISSWATFEHVADARFYARELGRVLKPGGWLCAWTPNKWASSVSAPASCRTVSMAPCSSICSRRGKRRTRSRPRTA
jgi:SAM-dependent methyltransferase